ncbi:hypothetical protein [Candidatus Nitrosocosmicus sp. T]
MDSDSIKKDYFDKLGLLFENKLLDYDTFTHYKKRGVKIYDTNSDLKCSHLSKIIPYIVIGASDEFVNKMSVPYQATSFIAAKAFSPNSGVFIFKLLGLRGGGVTLLTGGSRKLGDNIFASLHRIIVGNQAIIVTVNNMMENYGQIWSWDFFGKHLREPHPALYSELLNLSKKLVDPDNFYFIVSIRSLKSISESHLVEFYEKNKIAMLNPKNNQKVIILTTSLVYDHLSKIIKESNLITFIDTGEKFDIHNGLWILREKYGVKYLLNDGGRKLSESIRTKGLLGEERITLEPFNPAILSYTIDDTCILGKKGWGIDKSELKGSIILDSLKIEDEKANVYVYPLDESKVLNRNK